MADGKIIIPFIKEQEGGLTNNTKDLASKNPCLFPFNGVNGFHTNKGVTWSVWVTIFGNTQASATRFFAMSDDDWFSVFKPLYWDKILGDQIKSQRIANFIVDWAYNSGTYFSEKDSQEAVNYVLHTHIAEDGHFGVESITDINAADENELYNAIIQKRLAFIDAIVANNSSQSIFLNGWKNRVAALVKYNLKYV